MKHFETNSVMKSSENYCCEYCDYSTSRKSQYIRHLTTDKHKKRENETNETEMKQKKSEKFDCTLCGSCFNSRTTLWRHKNKCNNENKESMSDKEVIMLLIKENSELKNMIMKVLENGTNNTTNNNTNNNTNTNCMNNNKAFNLNFFLNETCKNAMNISDFVESLHLQLSDLESIGDLGFVDGISKIIIKNLKALDETERPIHCTDKKRETVYIKDDNKWEKEDDNKTRLRNAINYVAHENTLLIPQWKAKHPDYNESSSIYSDKYNNMVFEILGGENPSNVNEDKIIKKIAKEVIIDKIEHS